MGHASVSMIGNVKVTTFSPPPAGFDPLKAGEKELLAYGFPSRPDPERFPAAHALWLRAVSRPWRWVTPSFRTSSRRKGPSLHRRTTVQNTDHSESWAGSMAAAGAGDAFKWITAVMSIPDPSPEQPIPAGAPEADVPYFLSTWIGIDGGLSGSQDVLQVGVAQEVVFKRNPGTTSTRSCFPYWEWYSGPGDIDAQVEIDGFPISPGDGLNALICVTSSTQATIFLTNQGSLDATSFTVDAPPHVALRGDTCQWIVERPTISVGGGPLHPANLPHFPNVYFEDTLAGTLEGNGITAASGSLLMMRDASGNALATAAMHGSILVVARE